MNIQNKQKGSILIVVVLVLGLVTASAIRLGNAMQAEQKVLVQKTVTIKARQILLGINEYYIAECYAGNGVYNQPGSVQQMVDAGYLPRGNYRNTIGEDFVLSIRKDGDVAIMGVDAVFNTVSDALSIMQNNPPSISVEYFPADNRIRWEMTNRMDSGLADLLKKRARLLQGGVSVC